MTSVTEQVILDQFPYLTSALELPIEVISAKTLVFVGCGTSYYLARSLAAASNRQGQSAIAVAGSEWEQRPDCYLADQADAVVIGLSRSGTTTETIAALSAAKQNGLRTVALSCEPGSTILDIADTPIYLPTDSREGIVMTVSASLMLLAGLRMLGIVVTADDLVLTKYAMHEIEIQCNAVIADRHHFITLGAGPLYGVACEAALKLQEMSLSHSQAFHPLEYRHGPISLIDTGSVVTMLYSHDSPTEEASVAKDVQAKGAKVIGIGGPGDITIAVDVAPNIVPLVALPALQLFGEKIAVMKNLDTETPRHLTKVVVLN